MNFSAILFRDIKLLLKFIQYITVVLTQSNRIIRFLFFYERVAQNLWLTGSHGHPTRSRKVRKRYHRPWRHFLPLAKRPNC